MTIARTDESFMRETLRLAKKGAGSTNPNPMVGAILVRGGRVIARGYHHAAGKPHAEIEALLAAGGRATGTTLYVNLEPCRHSGRTPPCVLSIIRAKINRVVCAARDPNPVARGGVGKLRRAGSVWSEGQWQWQRGRWRRGRTASRAARGRDFDGRRCGYRVSQRRY